MAHPKQRSRLIAGFGRSPTQGRDQEAAAAGTFSAPPQNAQNLASSRLTE